MTVGCRWNLRLWLGLLALLTFVGSASGKPPEVARAADLYARFPAIGAISIAPSGRRIAIVAGDSQGHLRLNVLDLDPLGEFRTVAGFNDADIYSFSWVDDDRLVYTAAPRQAAVREGEINMYAVDHDGKNGRLLVAWSRSRDPGALGGRLRGRELLYGWFLHVTLADGTGEIIVRRRETSETGEFTGTYLARLDTRTGALRTLNVDAPRGVSTWILDPRGEPRVAVRLLGGRHQVLWRPPESEREWKLVADFALHSDDGFVPLSVDYDGSLLVSARNKKDTAALYRFDPKTRRLDDEPQVAVEGFDIYPRITRDFDTQKVLGIHFLADREVSYWFDDDFRKLQAAVDAALPRGRTNRLYCRRCSISRFIGIWSFSDRQPGELYLMDRSKLTVQRIGASNPWIDEKNQGRRSFHRIRTPEGLSMPVIVTHPAGLPDDKPLPAVVLLDSGLFGRGADTGYESEAQFLASLGYRVLQPGLRGSTGFGDRHFKAGWKQLGRGTQQDLATAVEWAVQRKLVDARRVCVYGRGFGGFVALMAPISHPGRYRCVVTRSAVTDLRSKLSVFGDYVLPDAERYTSSVLFGDPDKDRALLDAVSPRLRAGEIKVPVLMAHGLDDRDVPVDHTRQFISAARGAGVTLEPPLYPEDGYRFFDPKNHVQFLETLQRFLEKSLAPAD